MGATVSTNSFFHCDASCLHVCATWVAFVTDQRGRYRASWDRAWHAIRARGIGVWYGARKKRGSAQIGAPYPTRRSRGCLYSSGGDCSLVSPKRSPCAVPLPL